MTKKLFWSMLVVFAALSAKADADRDPNLEEPVELRIENNINTTLNVDIFNAPPAISTQQTGYQVQANYFHDNGGPLPPYGSLVPVIIPGNMRIASPNWALMTDLMQYVQYELNKQGYNTNLGYYSVQSVQVNARAIVNGSQIAIANSQNIMASMIVPHFNNSGIVLFNAVGNMNGLNWPLNILFQGQIEVQSIMLFLSPNVGNGSSPGWGNHYPPHQPLLQLGRPYTFDKRPLSGRTQTATFRNINLTNRAPIAYPGYRQIVVEANGNSFMSTKVRVEYINSYGFRDGVDLSTRRTNVRDGEVQVFDIPFGIAVQSVTVQGYSPNARGSRAKVSVGLR